MKKTIILASTHTKQCFVRELFLAVETVAYIHTKLMNNYSYAALEASTLRRRVNNVYEKGETDPSDSSHSGRSAATVNQDILKQVVVLTRG